jgi:hypothetical protein
MNHYRQTPKITINHNCGEKKNIITAPSGVVLRRQQYFCQLAHEDKLKHW